MLANGDRRGPGVLENDCPRPVADGWPRSIRRHLTVAASVPVLINEPVRSHRHCARRAFKRDLINTFCVNRHKRFPRLAAFDNRDRNWPRFATRPLRTLLTLRALLALRASPVP